MIHDVIGIQDLAFLSSDQDEDGQLNSHEKRLAEAALMAEKKHDVDWLRSDEERRQGLAEDRAALQNLDGKTLPHIITAKEVGLQIPSMVAGFEENFKGGSVAKLGPDGYNWCGFEAGGVRELVVESISTREDGQVKLDLNLDLDLDLDLALTL